jgi:three-Cys-motif partner protein
VAGSTYSDSSPEYWDDYNNLQWTKHALIGEYLKGWFPKLGLWAGRILYVDTYAGKGRHRTGHPGSPLIALQTLLAHSFRDRVLSKSEIRFVFIERDEDNLAELRSELSGLGAIPDRVAVECHVGDCEQILRSAIDDLRASESKMAPSFVFVDPYTFRIQYSLLREIASFPRVELLVNVMWRTLNMAIAQGAAKPGMASTLDFILGGGEWRTRVNSSDHNVRADQVLRLIREQVDTRWMTTVRMLGPNGAPKYFLIHLTNHEAGRDLMKEAMWKVCPRIDGTFVARQSDDPAQGVLLALEPDLRPLATWVIDALRKGPVRWQAFDTPIRETLWMPKHLNAVISDLRRAGVIEPSDYQGRFSRAANPLLSLAGGL